MKVLLLGEYTDNYLTLGGRTFHVDSETIASAQRAAEAESSATRGSDGPAIEGESSSPPSGSRRKKKAEAE